MFKSKRGFISPVILIFLAVLFLGLFGGYYFIKPILLPTLSPTIQPTPPDTTDTSNLKTYKTDNNISTRSENIAEVCKSVLESLIDPVDGIEFDRAYCSGDLCLADTKEACESKDIIKVENDKIISGKDGMIDCYWEINIPTKPFCKNSN